MNNSATRTPMARLLVGLSLTCLSCTSCATIEPKAAVSNRGQLMNLRDALTGSFDSQAQASMDESYFNIVLHMKPMWTWRDDGPWLYVEQAVASAADTPYRQRVYKLEPMKNGRFRSRVFTFDNPLEHAGAWESGSPLSEMSPDDLQERIGCAVIINWDRTEGLFAGSTEGNGCTSELNGAAYATSEVTIEDDRIVSWDRGYDATGQQVWGAELGGYEFLRIQE